MDIIDYICICVCALHFIVSLIVNLVQGHKLKSICKDCGQPIYENVVVHNCKVPDLGSILISSSDVNGIFDAYLNKEQVDFLKNLYTEVTKNGSSN